MYPKAKVPGIAPKINYNGDYQGCVIKPMLIFLRFRGFLLRYFILI